jgi:hypothetical protein
MKNVTIVISIVIASSASIGMSSNPCVPFFVFFALVALCVSASK